MFTSFSGSQPCAFTARSSMPCAVDANGTEIVLPFSSASDCTGELVGTTMPLPLPAMLPDSTVMKMLFLPALWKRGAVERAGEVGHRADVELAGHHLVGQRRARGEVLPLDVVLHVLVLAVVRQVLFEQVQLADQQAAGGAVDGGVLRADGDADGLGREAAGAKDRAAASSAPAKSGVEFHAGSPGVQRSR